MFREDAIEFEHALRKYVRQHRDMCTNYNTLLGASDDPNWSIEFNTADGGKWAVILPYRYKLHNAFTAAMLSNAIAAAGDSALRMQKYTALPARLPQHLREGY